MRKLRQIVFSDEESPVEEASPEEFEASDDENVIDNEEIEDSDVEMDPESDNEVIYDDDESSEDSFESRSKRRKVPFAKRQNQVNTVSRGSRRKVKRIDYSEPTEDEFFVPKLEPKRPTRSKRKIKKKPVIEEIDSDEEIEEEPLELSDNEELSEEEDEDDEDIDESSVSEDAVVEKIIAHREEDGNTEYFVKWKGKSYLHASWVPTSEFEKDRFGKSKVLRYHKKNEQYYNEDDDMFNPAYVEVDRIVTHEGKGDDIKYLTKWNQLPYSEATWESPKDIGDDEKIAQYHTRNKSIPQSKWKIKPRPSASKWQKYDESPTYKSGHKLRDYQLEGLNWLTFCWYNNRSSILADEMGLGKTVQTVSVVNHLFEKEKMHGPFLIIAPLITVPHWQREFEGWTNMNTLVYHGNSDSRQMIRDYEWNYNNSSSSSKKNNGRKKSKKYSPPFKFNVIITTYEMIITDVSYLSPIRWCYIAVDEAHRLKNKNCKLTNVLKTFNYDHLLLLTGTPLQNNTEELWTLLNLLDPVKFESCDEFAEKFGDLKETKQVEKLHKILRPFLLRRMKEDVEKSIAPKEETIIEVELTTIQKQYYRAIFEKNFSSLNMGTKSSNVPSLLNVMMQLRKCCNHPYLLRGVEDNILKSKKSYGDMDDTTLMIKSSGKLVLIDKLLAKLKSQGHKVLIFSQMVRMLDILEDHMIYRNYQYERIDGSKKGNERQEAIDRFSVPGSDKFVFLLCTRAGGLGINLTAADTCIIYDSDWNPQNDIQAQARCHRIGQTQMVKIYRLLTRNTYEKKMFEKASLKLGLDQAVLTKMKSNSSSSTSSTKNNIPLDTKEVDELLKYGAYGAFDEKPGTDQYDEEDIDKILERSTTVVVGDDKSVANNALSSFSKASFISADAESNAHIDVTDPDFWKKLMPDVIEEDERIQYEPRKRKQVRRYGNVNEFELSLDARSESDSELEEYEETHDDPVDDGAIGWTIRERNRLRLQLQNFGYNQWHTVRKAAKLEKFTIDEIREYTNALVRKFTEFLNEDPNDNFKYLEKYHIPERYAPKNNNSSSSDNDITIIENESNTIEKKENDDKDSIQNMEIDKDNLNIEKDDNKNNIIIDETLSKEKSNEENIKENIDEEKSVEIKSIDDKSNNDDVVMGESSIDTEILVPSNGKSNDDIPMKELSEEKIEDKKELKKEEEEEKEVKEEEIKENDDKIEQEENEDKKEEDISKISEKKEEKDDVSMTDNDIQSDHESSKDGDEENDEEEDDEDNDDDEEEDKNVFDNDGTLNGTEFNEYAKRNAKLLIRRLESIAKASKATLECIEKYGEEIPIPDVPGEVCTSWTSEDDRSLIVGTYKHGYNRFAEMRNDTSLSFTKFEDPNDIPVNIQNDPNLIPQTPKPLEDGTIPPKTLSEGKEQWPSEKILNRRLRKALRLILLGAKSAENSDKSQKRKTDIQEDWSKREKLDFYRVITTHGIRTLESTGQPDWEIIKEQAKLTRKNHTLISEYCANLMNQCKQSMDLGAKDYTDKRTAYLESPSSELEWIGRGDSSLSYAQCKRVLQRVKLFQDLRTKILPKGSDVLDDIIQKARTTTTLPLWWTWEYDKALVVGVTRHGFGQWEKLCTDEDLPFYKLAKQRLALSDGINAMQSSSDTIGNQSPKSSSNTGGGDSEKEDDDSNNPPKKRKRGRQIEIYTTALDFPKEKVLTKRLDYLIKFITEPPKPKKQLLISSICNSAPVKQISKPIQPPVVVQKPPPKPSIKKYQEVLRTPNGEVVFPIELGKMKIDRLGDINPLPEFHTSKYIWPVGYKSRRSYQSFKTPDSKVEYSSEILEGENQKPLFRVTASDAIDEPADGNSATAAWSLILRRVKSMQSGDKIEGEENRIFNAVSGPEYFGLARGIVRKLIQELPRASECENYQFIIFEKVDIPLKRPTKRRKMGLLDTIHSETAETDSNQDKSLSKSTNDDSDKKDDDNDKPKKTKQSTINFGFVSTNGSRVTILN